MKSPVRQRGFSLVELLVSMVLGLVVVGAVVVTYASSGASGARQNAVAQMGEDAQLSFSLLARDLQMAGYSEVIGSNPVVGSATVTTFTRKFTGRPLFACSTPMTSVTAALDSSNEDGVTCQGSGTTESHSLVVNYEANAGNVVVNSSGVPTNCLGAVASSVVGGTGTNTVSLRLVSNRYFVSTSGTSARPELSCAGPGLAGQPLVENVEAIRLWMGEAAAAEPRRPARYVTPDQVTDWGRVIAVRICLLMRSAEPVLSQEDVQTYVDCSGGTGTSTDGRIRRAFHSTVALRNKTGF